MGLTTRELFNKVSNELKLADIKNHDFETMCIFEDIGGISKNDIILNGNKEISKELQNTILTIAKKRKSHYPLQYLLKNWEFYGINFEVGEGVLIPRSDTETVVIQAEKYINSNKDILNEFTMIDLFSGSGCIAIAVESILKNKSIKNYKIYAIENSKDVLPYIKKNIIKNSSLVNLYFDDALNKEIVEKFNNINMITANPPYLTKKDMESLQKEVTFEPVSALFGGDDGLYFYKKIIDLWKPVLTSGGIFITEIGAAQGKEVAEIFKENNYKNINIIKDLSGNDRAVIASKI